MFRNVRAIFLLTLANQAIGFGRTALIAAALGASLEVGAYNLGQVAPTFVVVVIGGWLQAGFVGSYSGYLARGEERAATAYRTRMFALVVLISLLLALTCAVLTHPIVSTFLSGHGPEERAAAASALRLMAWVLVPTVLSDFIGLILTCHGRFSVAAAAPVYNAAISVLALWLWPTWNLSALIGSFMLGAFVQLIAVAIPLVSMRLPFAFDWKAGKQRVFATLIIVLPIVPAMMFTNATWAVLQLRTADLGLSAVAVLGYALRLHNSLFQLILTGLSIILLPHFATLWAQDDLAGIVALMRRLIRSMLFVCGYLLVGVILLGIPALELLLGRGAFDTSLIHRVAYLWAIFTLALYPWALCTCITKLAVAMQKPTIVLVGSVLLFGMTVVIASLGAHFRSLPVIVLANAVSYIAMTALFLVWVSRTTHARGLAGEVFKATLIAIPIFAIPALIDYAARGWTEILPLSLSVLVRAAIYTALVAALVHFSRLDGWYFGRRNRGVSSRFAAFIQNFLPRGIVPKQLGDANSVD
jgi:putative peptidoglycan lipid II flippase